MNVQAAAVERRAASPIMARFHGMRSIAVLLRAMIGAACVSVGLALELTVVGVVAAVLPIARDLLCDPAPPTRQKVAQPQRLWIHPTVVILSAVTLASFLCEGSASDWSGDYLNHVVRAGLTVAVLSYVPFGSVMALTRLGAPRLYQCISVRWLLAVQDHDRVGTTTSYAPSFEFRRFVRGCIVPGGGRQHASVLRFKPHLSRIWSSSGMRRQLDRV